MLDFADKGRNIGLYTLEFTAPTRYIMLFYADQADPANAAMKWEGEFTSPESLVQTFFMNGKAARTETIKKVK